MDLFIYSDESGVFDKEHNELYVYGGLIFLGKEQKESKKDKQRYLDYVYKIGLKNCDSSKVSLIRAADIVANRIYYMALNRNIEKLEGIYLSTLP